MIATIAQFQHQQTTTIQITGTSGTVTSTNIDTLTTTARNIETITSVSSTSSNINVEFETEDTTAPTTTHTCTTTSIILASTTVTTNNLLEFVAAALESASHSTATSTSTSTTTILYSNTMDYYILMAGGAAAAGSSAFFLAAFLLLRPHVYCRSGYNSLGSGKSRRYTTESISSHSTRSVEVSRPMGLSIRDIMVESFMDSHAKNAAGLPTRSPDITDEVDLATLVVPHPYNERGEEDLVQKEQVLHELDRSEKPCQPPPAVGLATGFWRHRGNSSPRSASPKSASPKQAENDAQNGAFALAEQRAASSSTLGTVPNEASPGTSPRWPSSNSADGPSAISPGQGRSQSRARRLFSKLKRPLIR